MKSVDQWLAHLETLHSKPIELGLERVGDVRDAMGLNPAFPLITVAGTNGKGSTCAMLESILSEAGFRVGCYTSPHILRYHERVRVARKEIDDAELIDSFRAVEVARDGRSLTYFEFATLAAMQHFIAANVDVAILEVGLGGRLDAVNVFDADCAILTSVALDHMDFLGPTRETIGREKAGVFRPDRPAVCAEQDVPSTVTETAEAVGAELIRAGTDYRWVSHERQWDFVGRNSQKFGLPVPALRGTYQIANAAAVLAALEALGKILPVDAGAIRKGLASVRLAGRFEVLPGKPLRIFDVAHNPHGAAALADTLSRMPCAGRTLAVFSMFSDKDVQGVVAAMKAGIDQWFVAPLEGPRATSVSVLMGVLTREHCLHAKTFDSPADAYRAACASAQENDRIVIFGSFHTVGAVKACLEHGDCPSEPDVTARSIV